MGLDVLHPHSALARRGHLTVDIVAVHGLGGDALKTWTDAKTNKLWLHDFLPADIDGTRVMSFRYNADAAFGNTTANISDCASDLLGSLAARRQDVDETARPIVFIAHSLGGIVVKQALVLAEIETKYASISHHTKGVFFLATPHKGSDFANYGNALARIATRLMNRPRPQLLNALQNNSQTLMELTTRFTTIAPKFQIATFYELKPMGVLRSLIVEKESAILGVEGEAPQGVNTDHVGICRFGSQGDDTYFKLIWRLRGMLGKENTIQLNRDTATSFQCAASYNQFYEVPHNVSSIFTGRDDISSELREKCLPAKSAITQKEQTRFVLYGLGGIGKTQICLKFAQDHRESFWGIFFVDVSSTTTAEQSFSKLARSCRVGDDPEAFKKWLSNRTEHWLLVLDNADDLSLDIASYFPIGARGTIIITTRNPQHELYKTVGGGSAQVDTMNSDEATSLLLKASLNDENHQSSRSRAQLVVQLLGFIPLAIIHAGAAIKEGYTFERYCEAFTDRRKELLRSWNVQVGTDYKYTVYATWEVSVNAIRKSAKGGVGVSETASANAVNALDLLNVFGFWYNGNICEDTLQEIWERVPSIESDQWWMSNVIPLLRTNRSTKWDPLPFRQAVNVLSNYSLVYKTGRWVSLHPLVQTCIQDLLDDESRLRWWTISLIMLVLAVRDDISRESIKRQRLLAPHFDTCLKIRDFGDFLVEDDSAASRVAVIQDLVDYDWRGTVLNDRLLLAQRAFEYGKNVLDENDPKLWRLFKNITILAINARQWQTIVDLLETKVITYLNTHKPNSKPPNRVLRVLEQLIYAYYRLDKQQEALELGEKVLKIYEDSQDEDLEILQTKETLALVYCDLGQEDHPLEMAQSTCSKIEASLGEGSLECLRSKYCLAVICIRTGDPQKVVDLCNQIRTRDLEFLPEDHHNVLLTQFLLAEAYMYLGRPRDGIPLVVDALEKGEKAGEYELDMQRWRSLLEILRAMEAEQLQQQAENSTEIEDEEGKRKRMSTGQDPPSAVIEMPSRSKKGYKSWLRKSIGRK